MENIRDWNISRQLWWGHRIPVFTCTQCGEQWADRQDPTQCRKCGGPVEQDPDVLDTWFSSWLWPFSTLGWPDETADLKTFYPTNTLVTASEILFFWVARMVMAGYYCMGENPFEDVVINGTVRDAKGRRMSKSLGNGIDPREVIDEYGADALRFTLVAAAPTGTDIHLAPDDFKIGRNFANKLWNAARYVLMNVPADFEPVEPDEDALDSPDKWILHRLDATTEAVDRALASFRMNDAAQSIYDFLWHDYCDWYIEWSKPRLAGSGGDAVRGVLLIALERSLKLLHPFMPFVTEELWRELPAALREGESVMIAPWPEAGGWSYPAESASMELLQQVIGAARALRARYDVPPARRAPMTIAAEDPADRATLERFVDDVARLALASEARVVDSAPRGEGFAGEVVRGGVEVAVRLADLVDVERERERLAAEIAGVERLLASSRAKLADERFVSRAPADVVAREREKAADLERSLERLLELESSLEAS